jgi:predicted dehydrogenase
VTVDGSKPIRFLSTGLGGYAWNIAQLLGRVAQVSGGKTIQLVGVSEPAPDRFPRQAAELESRGVKIYTDFDLMLAREKADAVWLPLPIHLHRSFAERALAKGLHVVTEKPAAGCIQDVDAMSDAERKAGKHVLIGFQDIYASHTLPAKKQLLQGAIGKLEHVSVYASWPRDLNYYARNNWAGTLQVDGVWVLDSPLQNAISHYLNLAMFLIGPKLECSAVPTELDVELYRANEIQNYDTCAMRIRFENAPPILVVLTHAAQQNQEAVVDIHGTTGALRVDALGCAFRGSSSLSIPLDPDRHSSMVNAIAKYLNGALDPNASAVANLAMARLHTTIVNGASEAIAVKTIEQKYIHETHLDRGGVCLAIDGIDNVMRRCVESRALPSELGDVPWAVRAGTFDVRNYQEFKGPKA